jgi:hypothetical protein
MQRISFRDKIAYPGTGPAGNYPSAFPANPFNPNAGEPRKYEGISTDTPQCPQCKVNLLIDDKSDVGSCSNCNSRFSKIQYDSAYSARGMNPGLFNTDGSNTNNPGNDGAGPNYHASDSIYGGNSVWSNPAASNNQSNN